MRVVRFNVSPEVVSAALHMPDTSRIVAVEMAPDEREITVLAEDLLLPSADEVRDVSPTITKREVTWDWGVEE